MTRRQSLGALAASRGKQLRVVHDEWWTMHAEGGGYVPDDITVHAPTRRAAEAGLMAALLALPERKEKKR